LANCVRYWIRLLRGRVLLSKNQTLLLNGGQLSIPEPMCPYELWMFFEVPFAQYYGHVSVVCGSTQGSHTIKVPLRNPFLYSVRTSRTPIVWRSPCSGSGTSGECHITFHLSPSFADGLFDYPFRRESNKESVTVMVKAALSKRSHPSMD
jgi:hypothetical protein